jgi:hypothetical protein
MLDIFSAAGLRVQTPCGPRKSGIPESVEIPAPLNTSTRLAASIQPRANSMSDASKESMPLAALARAMALGWIAFTFA